MTSVIAAEFPINLSFPVLLLIYTGNMRASTGILVGILIMDIVTNCFLKRRRKRLLLAIAIF